MKKIIFSLFLSTLFALPTLAAKNDTTVLKIDTGSVVKWTGRKVAGAHNGTVDIKEGSLNLTSGNPTSGTFTLDMSSIKNFDLTDATYNTKLVNHLKSGDFFNVEKFPTGEFKLKSAKLVKAGEYEFTGSLTIKGISKDITFPAKVTESSGKYSATGAFKINRLDWDIKYNSGKFFDPKKLGDKMIKDDIEIELDIKMSPAGA